MTLNFTPKPVTLALMQPRTLAFLLFTAYVVMCLCGCASQAQTAAKLKSNITGAQTSASATGNHIKSVQGGLDRIDYKASRAKKLLDQGVDQ